MSGQHDFLSAAKFLSQEYHEHNGTTIEVLERPPSALEFSRLAHISRPVIIKGFHVDAATLWTNEYLISKMGDRKVSVAATPNGRADAVTQGPDGRLFFVEPATDEMTMEDLLVKLAQPESSRSSIHYLQSQNGNLFSSALDESQDSSELFPLTKDVPKEVLWCSEAFGQRPDAVNIWIGNEKSVTSIHSERDMSMAWNNRYPYENIYTVIRGEKHFVVLPPTDSWSLKEKLYPHASYERQSSGQLAIIPSGESIAHVRWSSILDPDEPGALSNEIHPIHITLQQGDSLYLPVGWWHHVRQSGLTIALNWWYDAELRGISWVLMSFLRNSGVIGSGNKEIDEELD